VVGFGVWFGLVGSYLARGAGRGDRGGVAGRGGGGGKRHLH
jgi:hypothetical protein